MSNSPPSSAEQLRSLRRRDLAQMARRFRIDGWHSMRKEELISAIVEHAEEPPHEERAASTAPMPINLPRLHASPDCESTHDDRLETTVVSPHWLRVAWRLSEETLSRAEVAMKSDWHRAAPIVRLLRISLVDDVPHSVERLADIRLPTGVFVWFVQLPSDSDIYQVQLGYAGGDDHFFNLVSSGLIETRSGPQAARPPASNATRPFSTVPAPNDHFTCEVDADILIHGRTHPQSTVSVDDIELPVERDGQFAKRFPINNGRQVFPVSIVTPDESERHMIVLAFERHTNRLEPQELERW